MYLKVFGKQISKTIRDCLIASQTANHFGNWSVFPKAICDGVGLSAKETDTAMDRYDKRTCVCVLTGVLDCSVSFCSHIFKRLSRSFSSCSLKLRSRSSFFSLSKVASISHLHRDNLLSRVFSWQVQIVHKIFPHEYLIKCEKGKKYNTNSSRTFNYHQERVFWTINKTKIFILDFF